MEFPVSRIITELIRYDAGDPRRVQHALKVYAFAKASGEGEGGAGDRRRPARHRHP